MSLVFLFAGAARGRPASPASCWVGELGEHDALRLAAATVMVAGAVWTSTQPSAAMLAAYEADPALASMRLDFTATLREVLEVLISGLLARSPGRPGTA